MVTALGKESRRKAISTRLKAEKEKKKEGKGRERLGESAELASRSCTRSLRELDEGTLHTVPYDLVHRGLGANFNKCPL